MKTIFTIVTILFAINLNAQTNKKKVLLAENKEVSLYLVGKNSIMTGKNRVLVVSHTGEDYRLSVTGASMVLKEGYWYVSPGRGAKTISIQVSVLEKGKKQRREVLFVSLKVAESPQEKRKRELGM